MKSDPDKLLNQLVVAALTLFIVVIMLLAAVVLRQHWLQQRIVDLSSEVQVSLEDLEETNEEIQQELGELRTVSDGTQTVDDWQEIAEALDDMDEQLDSIGDDLNEVVLALEPEIDSPTALIENANQSKAVQDQVDQVFTIFAILVGLASIAIAILLGTAVKVQHNVTSSEGQGGL